MMPPMNWDVVIIGGSLSGASTAILLRRECPDLRVLLVERSENFTRRVGEATVEISGYFLCRMLGLTGFLNETQYVKQGLRFWFSNDSVKNLGDCAEIGPRYNVRLPSYQIDRAVLDEEVLRRAREAGVEIMRPATVTGVELQPGGNQSVTVKSGDATSTLSARWVVDASGVASFLSRKLGFWQRNTEHPTSAVWARWKGVRDWDCPKLAEKYPGYGESNFSARNTATNHIVGDGWWSWWIPLRGGDVSIGIVFDRRLVEWPEDGTPLGQRFERFLRNHPVAAEMLEGASPIEGDIHWRKDLAYFSTRYIGDGFAIVGDAGAFLDPLYSPGMDWITFTVMSSVSVIAAGLRGEDIAGRIAEMNDRFTRSYRRWFTAIYKDKYQYIGEFDLLGPAFQMDLGLYYLGIVSQPFRRGPAELELPPFAPGDSEGAYRLMSFYNRRFASIARHRRATGQLGRKNAMRRELFPGFRLTWADLNLVSKQVARWIGIEFTEGWRSWGSSSVSPLVRKAGQ